jgi:Tfp pilus assembly protein PilO
MVSEMSQTRKWSFGTAAVIVLLLAASWFLLISPQRTQAAELSAQADGVVAENQSLQTQIATLQAQQKQLPKWQAQLADLQTQLPPSPALPGLIRELSDLAKAAGVELTALTPTTPVTIGGVAVASTTPGAPVGLQPGTLAGMDVQLTVSGGYFEIQQFVNNLERMKRVMLVTGLNVAAEDTTTTTTSTTTTDTKPANELGGSITGRVFLVPPGEPTATTTGTTTTTTGTTPAAQ